MLYFLANLKVFLVFMVVTGHCLQGFDFPLQTSPVIVGAYINRFQMAVIIASAVGISFAVPNVLLHWHILYSIQLCEKREKSFHALVFDWMFVTVQEAVDRDSSKQRKGIKRLQEGGNATASGSENGLVEKNCNDDVEARGRIDPELDPDSDFDRNCWDTPCLWNRWLFGTVVGELQALFFFLIFFKLHQAQIYGFPVAPIGFFIPSHAFYWVGIWARQNKWINDVCCTKNPSPMIKAARPISYNAFLPEGATVAYLVFQWSFQRCYRQGSHDLEILHTWISWWPSTC
jgi:hypothetical protein